MQPTTAGAAVAANYHHFAAVAAAAALQGAGRASPIRTSSNKEGLTHSVPTTSATIPPPPTLPLPPMALPHPHQFPHPSPLLHHHHQLGGPPGLDVPSHGLPPPRLPLDLNPNPTSPLLLPFAAMVRHQQIAAAAAAAARFTGAANQLSFHQVI